MNAGIVVAIALSPWYALAAALTALRGAGVGFGISIWDTMLMERVPGHMLARVVSLDWFGSLGLMPLGFLLAAGVSSLASPGTILATGAAASGALFLVLLPSRWLREVD